MLEALLARVQKRANEPRQSSVEVQPSPGAAAPGGRASASLEAVPLAREAAPTVRDELAEEDIEEYDDELIEIIDDADVIPQAAAAARAIEPGAFGASLDRRPGALAGARPSVTQSPATQSPATQSPATQASSAPVASPSITSPSFGRPAAVRTAPVAEALRPEAVAPRPVASTEVARSQGKRRDLRSTAFLELLDASLELGR
jgi:hypothetical protein